jgi:putative MATE family efflux protein
VPTERSIPRRLFDLAWPIIGLNVLNVLALAVDTAMCGRLEDADTTLAALGYASQLIFLLLVMMMGVTVGAVATVSRAHGAGETERVNHILLQSTQLTVLLGVFVAVGGNLLGPTLLRALGADEPTVEEALRYLRPLLVGQIFAYLAILYAALLRGVGNTRLPFAVALVSNLVNFGINYCLILGNFGFPRLGIFGAAVGTISAQAVSAITLMALLHRRTVAGLYLPLALRRIDGRLARELFRVGAPAALDMLLLNAQFLSIVGMLGRFQDSAVAAHGIGLRVQALAFVPGLSVSQATSALVGNALGAHRPEEARAVTRASLLLCTAIMTTLGVTIIAGADAILSVFDVAQGNGMRDLARTWMTLLGLGMPLFGLNIAFVGLFRGSGATNTSLVINAVSTVFVQVPLSYVLGFWVGLGPFGVWLGFPLSFVVKATLAALAYRRGHWARTGVHA